MDSSACNIQYSILIPLFNEEESLAELYTELCQVMKKTTGLFEIIFINDGSTDGSEKVLSQIVEKDPKIQVIHFVKNYGKSAAYMAAFEEAKGEIILTLDADMQDNPREIPRMIKALKQGNDLVVGWKKKRFENEPLKKIPSFFYNGLKGLLFGLHLHDSNCGFRVMRKSVAQSLNLFGDRYRFIPELAHRNGFKVREIPVDHRRRKYGVSKYGITRFITGFLDILTVRFSTSFSQRPLHFFGSLGILPILLGSLCEIYALIQKLSGSTFQTHIGAIIIGVMLIIIGFQFLALGLIGEMISERSGNKTYTIRTIETAKDKEQ